MSNKSDSRTERALFDLFMRLDFRDKNDSGKKKFIGILSAYLFSNSIIAFNFFSIFDRSSFMILTLSSGVFLMAILVLNDFDNLILAGSSYSSISVLPVEGSSFFKAKFMSAVVFLLPFVLVTSIPQSIFFYFYNKSLADLFVFFIASFSFAMMTVAVLIFLYSLVILKFKDKATILMSLVQFGFFIFVFYSSTVGASRPELKLPGATKLSVLDKPGIQYLPQALLAQSVDKPLYLFVALAITGVLFIAGYKFISENYLRLSENALEISKKRRARKLNFKLPVLKRITDRIYLRNDTERSSFYLVMNHLANSRFLRLKYIPYLIMPLMFIATGFIFDMKGMIYFERAIPISSAEESGIAIVSPSILVVLMMSARMLISNTKIMDDLSHDTEWIYKSLPNKDSHFVIKGASKFIYLVFLIPVLIFLLLVLTVTGGFISALMNILFAGFGIYFINTVASLFDKVMPFTLESGKFNSASKLGEIFIAMALGIILFLIQIFAFQNSIFAMISIFLFILLSYLINRN